MEERKSVELEKHSHEINIEEEFKNRVIGLSKNAEEPELDPLRENILLEEAKMDASLKVEDIDENGAIIKDDFIPSEVKAFPFSIIKTNEEKVNVEVELVELVRYRINIHNQIKNLEASISELKKLEKKLTSLIGEENLDLQEYFKESILSNIQSQTEKVVSYINDKVNNKRLEEPMEIKD